MFHITGDNTTMYYILFDIFWLVVLLDIIALTVMVIFFVNARIILRRQIINQRFFARTLKAAKTTESSVAAAKMLNIDSGEFTTYCEKKGIDTPEVRIEKKEKAERMKREEEQKILQEKANKRAEKEKLLAEKHKEQEEDARKRKKRL